ncbi:serine dehydratase subunit alpha family protein [uncultured Veillonella sp.]|uniref:L-cysteine desulfidase family protein n=1 Tax=uncultured Veillonella sp. TaxID=159268 RepID=UPI002605C455|nr:L-serine ammonia-lyase, iron-sulfur-dependent, subunit alpha [uncultured Veillonella sp.]
MNKDLSNAYVSILEKELVVALGCTEPIAIAFACAKARDVLGSLPTHLDVYCSGNIIKNVKGVTVPHSNGKKGIEVAAILGAIAGHSERGLAVLEGIKNDDLAICERLLEAHICNVELVENVPNLFIRVVAHSETGIVEVVIENTHSNIILVKKDDQVIFGDEVQSIKKDLVPDLKELLTVKDILEFANTVSLDLVKPVLGRQIELNSKIAEEGLTNSYGAAVGQTIRDHQSPTVYNKARAYAAAGSDARMSGCPLPVVINSGSGNQGITVSVPLIVYAREQNINEETLYRALIVSNLIALHQKRYIGSLSAYCGAVSAACGSACGIAYMEGFDYDGISDVITNTIATVGGMVCDGAKPSCAAKIAVALETAFLALEMAKNQRSFKSGEGLVKTDVEKTIACVGTMGRVGMYGTDVEILNLMLDKVEL